METPLAGAGKRKRPSPGLGKENAPRRGWEKEAPLAGAGKSKRGGCKCSRPKV